MILDAYGQPVEVEPIPDEPPGAADERLAAERIRIWLGHPVTVIGDRNVPHEAEWLSVRW